MLEQLARTQRQNSTDLAKRSEALDQREAQLQVVAAEESGLEAASRDFEAQQTALATEREELAGERKHRNYYPARRSRLFPRLPHRPTAAVHRYPVRTG